LWNAGGTLLASTTISNSSFAVPSTLAGSQWLFNNITDVTLIAGQYFVGMTQPTTLQDLYVRGDVSFNLPGSKGVGRFGGFGGGGLTLTFPSTASNADGFFGPNLSTTAIPEPTTMLLLGSGLIGLAGFRRKFRKN